MNIREYLSREAAAITDRALSSIQSAADWRRERPDRLARYLDRMGLRSHLDAPRTPLEVKVTSVVERPGYRIENLHFQSLQRLYVSANLYIPARLRGPAPAITYALLPLISRSPVCLALLNGTAMNDTDCAAWRPADR